MPELKVTFDEQTRDVAINLLPAPMDDNGRVKLVLNTIEVLSAYIASLGVSQREVTEIILDTMDDTEGETGH